MEKRKSRRILTDIECIIYDDDNNEEILGTIINVSKTGMGIVVDKPNQLKKNHQYQIQLAKRYIYDNKYSYLIFDIEFVRFYYDNTKVIAGAIIKNSRDKFMTSYIYMLDFENYKNFKRKLREFLRK